MTVVLWLGVVLLLAVLGYVALVSVAWRRFSPGVALIVLAASAAGRCASIPPPIRLDANAAAREALTGSWAGEYVGDEVDARRGTIAFRIYANDNDAYGEVRMRPNGSREASARVQAANPTSGKVALQPKEILTIRVIRARDGHITGELDRYWDPDRECRAKTTFEGTLSGNSISGTFETVYDAPIARTLGRWRVVRQ